MRELNIEFLEQYKHLDKLCREMYSCKEGVSAYIQDMDNTQYNYKRSIDGWEIVYRQLKHMRWMRNQLAHDVPIDMDFCKQSDIEWVKWFYNCILKNDDPLANVYNIKKQLTSQKPVIVKNNISYNNSQEKRHNSLWKRFVSKIKSWFAQAKFNFNGFTSLNLFQRVMS